MPSLIPKSSFEARPRLALEIRTEGVFAARSSDATGVLAQVARAELPAGSVQPSLRPGNIANRPRVVAAVRQVLSQLQTGKLRDVTLVVPDSAVRVLLLDFDTLPTSQDEVLAVLRFRLSKLLPFPAEAAQVSYQVMAERARQLQVLTVAIPYEVLAEYESIVRESGFEPGAVLSSTLAVASAVDESTQTASLLVNASETSLTTAILRRGELLLHRTLETEPAPTSDADTLPGEAVTILATLPADVLTVRNEPREFGADDLSGNSIDDGPVIEEFVPARDLFAAEQQNAAVELQRSIAVAAAYYEDSLAAPPEFLLTAGSLSAPDLATLLEGSGLQARELLQASDLAPTVTTPISPGLLAALRGALRSGARS